MALVEMPIEGTKFFKLVETDPLIQAVRDFKTQWELDTPWTAEELKVKQRFTSWFVHFTPRGYFLFSSPLRAENFYRAAKAAGHAVWRN